ncbi:MAG: AzlD domain-containing protein [Ottowia sp.]|uniref:AzlD domain-containing protein n=1 Tax=Ottowia sp. TaxID=1898956 RepID=UPI001D717050|nr:AzlD domain-containing protein [Ottowia sp.]MCB2024491.1 AzlD domain-containing protein [Ottowia sp.]MCB2037630.1 AzlD domain-containing protein [Ottowia sp.]MCB2069734.1 AzlD domain-containing protein [Ottowia sp.]
MGETDAWTLLVIVGLAVITVVARGFFFISEKPWRLPRWALRGLQYAPVAALTAVIAPDILLAGHALSTPWRDARLLAALAAAAFYFWRRGTSYALPASIGVGMAVFLPLHVGLGW